MTLRFKIIFVIGFIISVINLAYATLGFLYFMYEAKSMLNLVSCLVCVSGVSTLGQMIYASVVIFGDDADLCKEYDFAPKSYQFIYVWVILIYCFMALLCCCSCMIICIVSSNKKKKSVRRN